MKRKKKSNPKQRQLWSELFQKTTFRQWLIGAVIAVCLLAVLLINALPQGVQVEVGQVAKKDLAAPITAVNTLETERLREEAARQAVLEANEDPSFYLINPAIALRVEENITGILNLLRLGIAPEPVEDPGFESVPEALSVSEIDRRLIRDWKVEIPKDTLESIVSHLCRVRSVCPDHNRSGAGSDGRESAKTACGTQETLLKQAWTAQPPGELAHAAVIIGRQLIQPNLVLDTEKVNAARQQAMESVERSILCRVKS